MPITLAATERASTRKVDACVEPGTSGEMVRHVDALDGDVATRALAVHVEVYRRVKVRALGGIHTRA